MDKKSMSIADIGRRYAALLDKFKWPDDENQDDCYEALRSAQNFLLNAEEHNNKWVRCEQLEKEHNDLIGYFGKWQETDLELKRVYEAILIITSKYSDSRIEKLHSFREELLAEIFTPQSKNA